MITIIAQTSSVDTNLTHYLPIVTTIVAVAFTITLYKRWKENPSARYLMWWTIGIAMYGVGTLTEALTTVFGWSEPVFRAWYISGALLGGAPLATGTVYLVMSKKKADRIATVLVTYIAIASAFVLTTPIVNELVESNRLSGEVMAWSWVRLFSPLANLYALVFLVGGAIWSAWKYWKIGDASSRVLGNIYIAVGAILPGIGGSFARAGVVEVLYVTELIGILLIWAGFRVISGDRVVSVFASQRTAAARSE
ncbi:MAG: hypothetical protein M3132_00630 [Actinomycetia bacterium]|nr:hypothetical protein [Actinomycetes bacterium]